MVGRMDGGRGGGRTTPFYLGQRVCTQLSEADVESGIEGNAEQTVRAGEQRGR